MLLSMYRHSRWYSITKAGAGGDLKECAWVDLRAAEPGKWRLATLLFNIKKTPTKGRPGWSRDSAFT